MVDAADINRLPEAKAELDGLLQMKELENTPVVVFGNKVDRKEALKEEEFREVMDLPFHLTKGKDPNNHNPSAKGNIEVFMCSVKGRAGYSDGFTWLSGFLS